MTGLKYKLAHKRADKNNRNASDNAQRKKIDRNTSTVN
jgi:hypothetical protein